MKTAYISIIAIVLVSSLVFLGFFSVAQAQAQLTPLYRWFFSNNVDVVDHFYTTDPTGGIAPSSGYVYEGIVCYIATTQISGTTPFYCWWNSNIVDHFYTTDPTGGIAPGSGYVYECVVGYVATTQISGTTPFYCWWNNETGDHFYTTDPTGEAAPISEPGPYVYEGTACYVWAVFPSGTSPLPNVYNLIISSTEGGSVTTPGEGLFPYSERRVVKLVATQDAGYKFIDWIGDIDTVEDVNAAITKITMNGDYSVNATFATEEDPLGEYTLTISSTAGGSVTSPREGTSVYEAGTVVNLVASPDFGYEFVNWTGDGITHTDSTTTTVTMNGDYSIKANFDFEETTTDSTRGSSGPLACFIATAAYGTPIAGEIQILREFRDKYLLTNTIGQAFVDFYYKASPPIADFITEHPSLKPIVRVVLLPAVAVSTVVVNTTPAEKIVIVGLLVLVSVTLTVWVSRQRRRDSEYI